MPEERTEGDRERMNLRSLLRPGAAGWIEQTRASVQDHVIALAWHRNGRTLAAASIAGPVCLLDVKERTLVATIDAHKMGTTQAAFQPGGNTLATAGQDGFARLWSTEDRRELAALPGGAAWVEHLAWNRAGTHLLTAAGKFVKVWNANGELLRELPPAPSTVSGVAWIGQGDRFVVSAYGGLAVWELSEAAPLRTIEWKGSPIALHVSPDGGIVAAGTQDATIQFWSLRQADRHSRMSGYASKVSTLAWDSAGRYLATGGGPAAVVWDFSGNGPEGTEPAQLNVHDGGVSALAFANGRALLASGGAEGRVAVWKPLGGNPPEFATKLDAGVASLAWSPDDGMLAVGLEDGTVQVFKPAK